MLEQVWKFDVLDDYELEPLTLEHVKIAQEKLDVILPALYLELLKVKNGGKLYLNTFTYQVEGEDDLVIDHLFGIGKNNEKGLVQTLYLVPEWELPNDIILLSGDGHAWIALDYRLNKNHEPAVTYLDLEQELDIQLAHNFQEFVDKLFHSEDVSTFENIVFEGDQTEFTYEEGEEVFKSGNVGVISFTLLHFSKIDCDVNWLLNQINLLTQKEDEFIVQDAEEALMKIVLNQYNVPETGREMIQAIINRLFKNNHSTVRNYAKKIQRIIDNQKR